MSRFLINRPGLPSFEIYGDSYREDGGYYLFEQEIDVKRVVDRVAIVPGTEITELPDD